MKDTIYAAFAAVAAGQRDNPAVISDEVTLTFGELLDMADLIANTFPAKLTSVGIVLNHRAEMIAAMLAVLKCGARYVPAEPDFPAGRIRFMMAEAGVDFVLTEMTMSGIAGDLLTRFADCEICEAARDLPNRPDVSAPSSPAYVLYTSGTTGRPKGVCVTNANVCHYARAFANEFRPRPGDVMLQYSVCSFDIFVEEVFASLLNGVAVAIPDAEAKDDLAALMRFVERHRVTMISGFPYLMARLNHLPKLPGSLRLLISGGDVLRATYIDWLLPQVEVYNTYGPSETTVCTTYFHCNDANPLDGGAYPIGKAIKGMAVSVAGKDGRDLPSGEVGEIVITGDGVSLGYIGDHDKENSAFEKLPDGGVRYHSGDLGYVLLDGNLAFLHRLDTQVMIYGKRVEVAEVESRLYQCVGVESAIVRAFADERGLSYMIAYVVPSPGSELRLSELRRELAVNLAPFMIPEFIVKLPKIPLNVNGKPDAGQLPIVLKEGDAL